MALELRVPSVGESITEVQIGEWVKQEGQPVRKDETVVLIESEKATVEFPAPADGTLSKILKKRGDTARVGEIIGLLEPGSVPPTPTEGAPEPSPEPSISASEVPPAAPATLMPAARRVLAEAGIDPASVTPTGPGRRVTKEDALRAVGSREEPSAAASPVPADATVPKEQAPAPAPASSTATPSAPLAAGREEEIIPLSPLRRTVARRLVEAQSTMAMLTTFNEVDMSAVMALRKQSQEAFTARHGVKLGFMSFFVKGVIDALKQFPQLNAEIRENSIAYRHYHDIGVAIAGGKGLVVPVLRNAERLSFAEIEKAIGDFGARAKEGRIKPDELLGGTFTITNGGVFGSLLSTPIINPPQSGILGMHAIQDRPVAIEGQVVIRPMMYVALTYDHRIVDGREAVTFLKRVKEVIESPARMLLEA